MENNSDDSRKSGNKKSAPIGNQVLLYVLAVALGTWVVFVLYHARASVQLTYGQLEELVVQSAGSPNRTTGHVDVTNPNKRGEVRRYSLYRRTASVGRGNGWLDVKGSGIIANGNHAGGSTSANCASGF